MSEALRAPFPWMGGKSRVAALVWERFGDVPNYVEPFAGSLAVLLGRPHAPKVETVNDLDCYVANFWRCLSYDPEEVARWADWPVNEADLHARHNWLLGRAEFREAMQRDPDYRNPKVAGWWVWGLCQWIGSGWCAGAEPSQQLPHLGNPGRGVHRPSQKLPHLGGGRGQTGMGIHVASVRDDLLGYFAALADRLRGVRVCCGDWSRVLGPSPTTNLGLTGVFLDPPYLTDEGNRQEGLYACDSGTVAHEVRAWARAHGDDPLLRIALCGYQGEHDELEQAGWSVVQWKAAGGYGNRSNGRGRANAGRERIWFGPHCLRAVQPHSQGSLL